MTTSYTYLSPNYFLAVGYFPGYVVADLPVVTVVRSLFTDLVLSVDFHLGGLQALSAKDVFCLVRLCAPLVQHPVVRFTEYCKNQTNYFSASPPGRVRLYREEDVIGNVRLESPLLSA
jgi:hypothetical protein